MYYSKDSDLLEYRQGFTPINQPINDVYDIFFSSELAMHEFFSFLPNLPDPPPLSKVKWFAPKGRIVFLACKNVFLGPFFVQEFFIELI